MSDLDFRPIHKKFRGKLLSINYMIDSNSDMISLHIYNNSPCKITLFLGLLVYSENNATTSPTKK